MHKLRVLICDDMEHVRMAHEDLLLQCGKGLFHTEPSEASSGEQAVALAKTTREAGSAFDLILMDIDFGQAQGQKCMSGFQAAERIHELMPEAVIAMVSSYSTEDNYNLAATTPYIEKFFRRASFDPSELRELCKYALVRSLHARGLLLSPDKIIFTQASVMREYLAKIDQTPEDDSVFICGETGTGKGMTAYRLNANAKVFTNNPSRPLITLNCGSITPTLLMGEIFGHVRGAFTGADREREGWLQKADGGDIFLDELQNASSEFQQALLVFLQTGEFSKVGDTKPIKVKARVIAAFNEDPLIAISTGKLRADLFARLQKNYVLIPPLRERKGDIPALVTHFQALFGKADKTFSHDAVEFIESLPLNTNVREVQAVVETAIRSSKLPVITAQTLQQLPIIQKIQTEMSTSSESSNLKPGADSWGSRALDLFDSALQSGMNLHEIMTAFEKTALARSLKRDNAILRVAKRLRIPESSLRRKLEQHALVPSRQTTKRTKATELG